MYMMPKISRTNLRVYSQKELSSTPIYAIKKMRILRKEIGQVLKHHLQYLVEHLLSCDMPVDTCASAFAFKLQRIVSTFIPST
jgi:hypothetical protein